MTKELFAVLAGTEPISLVRAGDPVTAIRIAAKLVRIELQDEINEPLSARKATEIESQRFCSVSPGKGGTAQLAAIIVNAGIFVLREPEQALFRSNLISYSAEMEDIDIWRAAKLLIDRHGAEAHLQADLRIDELTEGGDEIGVLAWRKIRQAILELQALPATGEKLN